MKRCLLVFSALLVSASVSAQDQATAPLTVNENVQTGVPGLRKFPDKALRGKMQVIQAPEILIDGKRERLSPGARIRDTQQRIVMSASITNQEFVVNFLRNPAGEIQEAWILTDAEAKQKIKTNTPERNFTFTSEDGISRQDDGKTPFNQLPSFEQMGKQQRDQQPRR